MSEKDEALETAKEILDGTVCECGHLASDHVGVNTFGFPNSEPPNECQADFGDDDVVGCFCDQFSAVQFKVERA